MNLKLIKAKKDDVDFLYDLRMQTMSEHLKKAGVNLSKEEHLSRIDHQFDKSFLIMQSDKKVGMLKLAEEEDSLEITQLEVLPEFQGEGIGKQLIEQTIDKATSQNKKLNLKVLKRNPAKFLYLRSGFKIIDQDNLEFHMRYSEY